MGNLNAKNFSHRHSGPPDPLSERLWIPWKRGLRMRVRISFQEILLQIATASNPFLRRNRADFRSKYRLFGQQNGVFNEKNVTSDACNSFFLPIFATSSLSLGKRYFMNLNSNFRSMRKIVLLFMAVLGGLACAVAQNIKVSGTVTGVDGNPIAGATILLSLIHI